MTRKSSQSSIVIRHSSMLLCLMSCLLYLFSSGCQQLLEHSERELRDHTKSQQIFRNTLPVRTDQIGVAVGYFGRDRITKENNELIDEYRSIAATHDPNSQINFELAYSYGLGLRLYENMLRTLWLEVQGYWE